MPCEPLGSPRLLVICGSQSAGRWAADDSLGGATCEWAHDLYEALARLVSGPRFDALVLAPECLSRALVAAVPMVRKHLNIPVWILDKNTATFRAHVEQALALGAIRCPRSEKPAQMVSAPAKPAQPIEIAQTAAPKPLINGNGHAAPHPLTGKIPLKFEQENPRPEKSVAINAPASYDASTQEALLSEAELKALLGD